MYSEVHYQQVKHNIVIALQKRGLLDYSKLNENVPLNEVPLGVEGFQYGATCGLLLDKSRLSSTPRTLSQMTGGWQTSHSHVYFQEASMLAELYQRENYDPILYLAHRDIFPPRLKAQEQESYWYADLIEYRHGVLPTGELFRSTGHWNPDHQVEIFETLQGKVVIIIAGNTPDGKSYLSKHVCAAGDRCLIPPGAWHITYVLEGPALVFNIYSEYSRTNSEVRNWQLRKYQWKVPVEIALLEDSSLQSLGPRVCFSERSWQDWGKTYVMNVSAIPQHILFDETSLAEFFLFSNLDQLDDLEKQCLQYWHNS